MKTLILKSGLILFFGLLLFVSCNTVKSFSDTCPKKENVQKSLDAIQKGVIIEKIEESPVSGLCEVILKLSETQKGIFYITSDGKYIVSGSILDIKSLKNLTQEKLEIINTRFVSKDKLSELDKMTDIVYGNSKNVVYFITDPDCPYCKKAEVILDKMVSEGKISVKVILFPLEMLHPEAKAKAISLVCDKKGFKELMEGYKSNNHCEIGKKKIENNIRFLTNEIKIPATPTFIFPDGKIKSGLISEEYIMKNISKL